MAGPVGRHGHLGVHPVRREQPASRERVRAHPGISEPSRFQRHRLRLDPIRRSAGQPRRLRRVVVRTSAVQSGGYGKPSDVPDRRRIQLLLLLHERVDEIIAELGVAFDAGTKVDLQQELDKILFDEHYGPTLFQFLGVTDFSERIEEIDPAPLPPQALWNAWDWTMTDSLEQ